MILGTSAYKNGARATTFRPKVDAGLGYLMGERERPQVVRTYYLNMPATERVAKRARALREAAGTLSGVALGEDDAAPQRDVLADVRRGRSAAPAACTGSALADRLAERFPERWAEATGDAVRAELGARGVPSVVVVDGRRRGPAAAAPPTSTRRRAAHDPVPDAQKCYRPDLREHRQAVTAVTAAARSDLR